MIGCEWQFWGFTFLTHAEQRKTKTKPIFHVFKHGCGARGASLAMPVCQRNLTDSEVGRPNSSSLSDKGGPGKMHPGSEARITLKLIGQTWSNSLLSLTDGLLGDAFWKR